MHYTDNSNEITYISGNYYYITVLKLTPCKSKDGLPIQLTVGTQCYEVDGVVFYIYINSTDVTGDVDTVVVMPAATQVMSV